MRTMTRWNYFVYGWINLVEALIITLTLGSVVRAWYLTYWVRTLVRHLGGKTGSSH